jgi:hypothetical protein
LTAKFARHYAPSSKTAFLPPSDETGTALTMNSETSPHDEFRRLVTRRARQFPAQWEASRRLIERSAFPSTIGRLLRLSQEGDVPSAIKESLRRALGQRQAPQLHDLDGESLKALTGLPPAIGRIMDSFRLRWSRLFVQYSADDQLAVVRELKAGSASVRNLAWDSLATIVSPLASMLQKATHHVSSGNLQLLGGFLGLIVIGLSILIWLVWGRPWTTRFPAKRALRAEQTITRLYRRMISHLARGGIAKPITMPPLEVIRVTQEQWNEAGSVVATITQLYCRARFGQMRLTHEELRSAHNCLRQLMALE